MNGTILVAGVGITYFLDVLYAFLLSALYRGVGDDQEGIQNRLGCLFFIVLNLAYSSALPSINLFAGEKFIVIREQASGAYSTSAYYLSKLVAELPKLSSKLVFCTLVYWIVGFNPDPVRFLRFVVIVLSEVLAAQAIGMVMATGMPIGGALALGPACITVFTLFGGIYLNMDSIPTGAGWIRYVDFIYYAFSALCANEFDDPEAAFACGDEAARCLPDGASVLELYSFEARDIHQTRITQFGPLVHPLVHSLVNWSIHWSTHWSIGPFFGPLAPHSSEYAAAAAAAAAAALTPQHCFKGASHKPPMSDRPYV